MTGLAMTRTRSFSLGKRMAACATLVLVASGCEQRHPELLVDPVVLPGIHDGKKVGCDLSFHLVRAKDHQTWSSAIGVTLFRYTVEDQWIAGLKIGYQPSPGVVVRPKAAYLYDRDQSNEVEHTHIGPGEDPRYLVVQFGPNHVTRKAFSFLEDRGIARIGFRLDDGTTQVWTLDLDQRPDIRRALDLCLDSL